MDILDTSLFSLLFVYATIGFFISLILQRNDHADIAWGLGFVLLAWWTYFSTTASVVGLLVTICVTLWGLRLAWHIGKRFLQHDEDARYAGWRKTWKYFYLRSYAQVFLLQSALIYCVSASVIAINNSDTITFTPLVLAGFSIWIIGFTCEIIADSQLRNFLADPQNRGKIMDRGLWKYSRHPNYFGEVLLWWGIFLIALGTSTGFVALLSPITITILIVFVSGIPMLEKRFAEDTAYQAYKKKTSVLIPWPPKKEIS